RWGLRCVRCAMDELKTIEFGDAGVMPEALRARLRRRRWARRTLQAGGAGLVLVALVGGAAVLLGSPTGPDRGRELGGRLGPVLSIDDPMFDGLDGFDGRGATPRSSVRWRAGSWLSGELSLEI